MSSAGNIVSAAVCIALLIGVTYLRDDYPPIVHALRPFNRTLSIIAFAGSAGVFVASFIATRATRHVASRPVPGSAAA